MKYSALLFLLLIPFAGFAQTDFRVMFYNVENLFDTLDDPDTQDDEFTPGGSRRWTNYRYYKKLANVAKLISSVGEWEVPALVGLCEIENDKVLNDLVKYSPLRKMAYRYLSAETTDARGIRVALLYQRDRFRCLGHRSLRIENLSTRDILHAWGCVSSGDTLDLFVCHFPSRRDGQRESEPKRVLAASVLRLCIDSLLGARAKPQFIILGDFNDEPGNKSLSQTLEAQPVDSLPSHRKLYNLFFLPKGQDIEGTYKYQGEWNRLDQIIVSGALIDSGNSFRVRPESFTIFRSPYLLTPDSTHEGLRPKKTFHGYKYEGGYSDHLPVYVDCILDKSTGPN